MKLIINADDCGISSFVDARIEDFIRAGKISSTTIMANREDFEGAKVLYTKYNDTISFGIHLNLTDGQPLLYNEELVRSGHYLVENGKQFFNMKNPHNRRLTPSQKEFVYLELKAQIEKLISSGIKISHIDSHHHIHTDRNILPIVVKLAKEFQITKIRGLRNYMPFSLNKLLRNVWYIYLRILYRNVVHTDYFTSYLDFYEKNKCGFTKDCAIVELECHPGHPNSELEEKVIMTTNICESTNSSLINYCEL